MRRNNRKGMEIMARISKERKMKMKMRMKVENRVSIFRSE